MNIRIRTKKKQDLCRKSTLINIPLPSNNFSVRRSFLHFLSGKGLLVFLSLRFFFSDFSVLGDKGRFRGVFNLWKGRVGGSSSGNAVGSSNFVVGRACAISDIDWATLKMLDEARSSVEPSSEAVCLSDGSGC